MDLRVKGRKPTVFSGLPWEDGAMRAPTTTDHDALAFASNHRDLKGLQNHTFTYKTSKRKTPKLLVATRDGKKARGTANTLSKKEQKVFYAFSDGFKTTESISNNRWSLTSELL